VLAHAAVLRAADERVGGLVERRFALAADQPSGDAADELVVRNLDVDDAADGRPQALQDLIERIRLGDGPRETVEQRTEANIGLLQPLRHHPNRDGIRHELAARHVAFRP
jgi:hypothetical protein